MTNSHDGMMLNMMLQCVFCARHQRCCAHRACRARLFSIMEFARTVGGLDV